MTAAQYKRALGEANAEIKRLLEIANHNFTNAIEHMQRAQYFEQVYNALALHYQELQVELEAIKMCLEGRVPMAQMLKMKLPWGENRLPESLRVTAKR